MLENEWKKIRPVAMESVSFQSIGFFTNEDGVGVNECELLMQFVSKNLGRDIHHEELDVGTMLLASLFLYNDFIAKGGVVSPDVAAFFLFVDRQQSIPLGSTRAAAIN